MKDYRAMPRALEIAAGRLNNVAWNSSLWRGCS
jgi:hypothetical protein